MKVQLKNNGQTYNLGQSDYIASGSEGKVYQKEGNLKMERKTIWVCQACGKRSNDRYGKNMIDRGWDVSCVMSSVEVYKDKVVVKNSRVTEILDGGLV